MNSGAVRSNVRVRVRVRIVLLGVGDVSDGQSTWGFFACLQQRGNNVAAATMSSSMVCTEKARSMTDLSRTRVDERRLARGWAVKAGWMEE